MKLSTWAKKQGVSYQTAWRWWSTGKLPVPAKKMPSGAIIVQDPPSSETPEGKIEAAMTILTEDMKKALMRLRDNLRGGG